MFRTRSLCLGVIALGAILTNLSAVEPGKAVGSVTIDGATTKLTHAVRTTKKNAFDDTALDTVVVLSDRLLTAQEAADEAGLFARAQKGELVAMAVRFDLRRNRTRLFNVAVNHRGLTEATLLPDVFFESTFKGGVGSLKMPARDFNGHTYATDVEYAVTMPVETTTAAATTPASGSTALPPPSKTDADRTRATQLLIEALMEGDEERALAIVELGIDPNGRDKTGIPVINWAILMCQPQVVKALVSLKADLTHQRLPGMTLLSEAVAACPDAVPFLKAGGAQ